MQERGAIPAPARTKSRQFRLANQWHNFYFGINAAVWAALIILIAFLAFPLLRSTAILIGICTALSVISSAVLFKPGRRLAGSVIQVVAWVTLIVVTLLIHDKALKAVLVLHLPAGGLSLLTLGILGGLSLRTEKALERAMKR